MSFRLVSIIPELRPAAIPANTPSKAATIIIKTKTEKTLTIIPNPTAKTTTKTNSPTTEIKTTIKARAKIMRIAIIPATISKANRAGKSPMETPTTIMNL